MKNNCNKTRPKENPYEVWEGKEDAIGWTWNVLKKYQGDDSKSYARALCFVISPYTPNGDLGDVYINTYKDGGNLIKTNY